MVNSAEVFDSHRPHLFSLAYRMLGSVMDAEDMVQDAFLRWQDLEMEEIASPRAYLSTVVTRLAMDRLKSAQARREVYVRTVDATGHAVVPGEEVTCTAVLEV